jgi:hypothetical protein
MDPNVRTALLAGGIALGLLVSGAIGYALGRSGTEPARAAAVSTPAPESPTTTSSSPIPSATEPAVAIGAADATLQPGGPEDVTPAAATAPCEALVTPGLTGECGQVNVLGGRVVWIVERSAVADGVAGYAVRILAFSAADGGWVERLGDDDLQGGRWASIAVLPADLTHDGVAELVVGFRGLGERRPLDIDVVGYTQDGAPQVIAHPARASLGSAVVDAAGRLLEYAARFGEGEAACCPGAFELRTITYQDGLLRQVGAQSVPPSSVPESQL